MLKARTAKAAMAALVGEIAHVVRATPLPSMFLNIRREALSAMAFPPEGGNPVIKRSSQWKRLKRDSRRQAIHKLRVPTGAWPRSGRMPVLGEMCAWFLSQPSLPR